MQKPLRLISLPVWIVIGILLVFLVPVNFAASAQSATVTNTPIIGMDVSATPIATATPIAVATPIIVSATPQPVPRVYTLSEQYEGFVWWMVSYKGNQVLCEVIIEHEGQPTSSDILQSCGEEILKMYQATQSCTIAPSADVPSPPCEGVYIHWVKNFIGTRERTIAYPLPFVALNIKGCISDQPVYRCDQIPSLEITGDEPMDGQTITSIEGRINGVDFTCSTNPCQVTLQGTDSQGVRAEFWANSSSGVSSVPRTALIRVMPSTGSENSASGVQGEHWTVEVASSLWQGAPGYSCSQVWESLPEVTGLPVWLSSPDRAEKIKTYTVYYYLGGALIRSGQVNVEGCPDGGMQTNLIPNICGMLRATPLVEEWQNQFDQTIIESARRKNIPSMLIKSIFSRESQFWPGVYTSNDEFGLGQMTEGGADTLLMWNPEFFQEFCSEVFYPSVCSKGYFRLHPYEQAVIRGALLSKVNASCRDCAKRINLDQAQFSVDIFASSLVANCKQVDQVLYNLTGKASGLSASYVDLWKFTLVNYNAGSGCLDQAVSKTISKNETINWETVSANLPSSCQGAIKYVEDITNIPIAK